MRNFILDSRTWRIPNGRHNRWAAALAVLALLLSFCECLRAQPAVGTLGGGAALTPYCGYVEGNTYKFAMYNTPAGMALDPSGTTMFLADYTNNAIRLISQVGDNSSSLTSTFANATNNNGVAGINRPLAVLVDSATNVFVLNHGNGNNGAVLHLGGVNLNSGVALVYPVLTSNLVNATAMAMDGAENIYVTVNSNKVIRVTTNKVVTAIGTISQSGTALDGIAVLNNGQLALSDAGNNGIWIMNPATGTATKFTGFHGAGDTNGPAQFAAFKSPAMIAVAGGNTLVVADYGNHKVKLVDPNGTVSLLYGVSSNLWITGLNILAGWANGPGTATQGSAESRQPYGVLVGPDGSVYVTEDYYHIIRHVTSTGLSAPVPGYPPTFNGPAGIAYDSLDNFLFIANCTNNSVQELNLNNNTTSTFLFPYNGITNPVSVFLDANDDLYVLNQGTLQGYISEFDIYGNDYGPVVTGLNQPTAFTIDGYGNIVVAERSGKIRAFGTGVSNTIAVITNANVSLQGIALFNDGTIAISDAGNQVIWTINPITKTISRLTGQLGVIGTAVGPSNFAQLNQPHQLAAVAGNQIIAADSGNNRLVQIQRNGTETTNHLNSVNAELWFGNANDPVTTNSTRFEPMIFPYGVAVGTGGEIFASETRYADIRGLLATTLTAPSSNPGVPIPFYASPAGIALNNEGTILFITDSTNDTVSALNVTNNQTTVFLDASSGIYQPVDVAVDTSDNVYVLNQGTGGNGSISEFDQYGNYLGTIENSLPMPTAMKMDFFGDIYLTELNGLVQEFNASGSNTLANITTNANVKLQGIAVLDNGSVVVSDAGNNVIWQIFPNSTNKNASILTGVFGVAGTNYGSVGFAKLNKPMRLAEASGGLVLIADSGNNRVVVANDAGTVSGSLNATNASLWFGLPIDPVTPGSADFVPMVSPVGLVVGKGGTVFDSEPSYRLVRGMLSTGLAAPISPPPAPLNLVATASDGQVSLAWSVTTGATNYFIKRSTSTNVALSTVASTAATTYLDTNVISGTTYFYAVSASNAGGQSQNSAIVSATPLIPPPPAPRIGWFDYEGNDQIGFYSVMHPVGIATFNNNQLIAIDPNTNGVTTYYIAGPPPLTGIPGITNGQTPPSYSDGKPPYLPYLSFGISNIVIEAVNVDSIGQQSAVTTAQLIFQVANPTISGFNGAQFSVGDITTNAQLWYTLDGSDPVANGPTSIGPVSLNGANSAALSMVLTSNVMFKVRGYLDGYLPSGIAWQVFSPSNFVANTISFGFASGEASSDFVAAPGQTFYAPVTLTVLPEAEMYSLQFNVVVTNAGPNPGPPITPGAFNFVSMLMKPDPDQPGLYIPIPPYMFVGDDTEPLDPSQVVSYGGTNFVNLVTTDPAYNLLGAGWLERRSETNLYPTKAQDLIQFSLAHDDLFLQANGEIVAGGYSFQVPGNAASNQTYQIQIGRPSATSDGIGAPGSDVYIAAPTNGSTTNGTPINALKYVTVGQRKYLAGSVYPFRWFNAGDFGSSNIINADVEQVFQSAIYALDYPPIGSDFFDAMDSCGATYVDLGHGYLEFNSYISGVNATSPLFNGDDTSINQIAFGDGVLDVCDVYVTYRRSLDPSLAWFQRYWNNGQRVAQVVPNVAAHSLAQKLAVQPKLISTPSTNAQVNFTAVDVLGTAGQTVQVPINASVFGSYPLRVLMLNLTVTPLDGSPALTTPVAFTQTATVLGSPLTTSSDGVGNYSAVWLNSTNAGLTGAASIGYLTITIPSTANSLAAYAIHFDHASASPNGLASFPKQAYTGLITLSNRTNSYYQDGIPDSWRLRWFGTIYNVLSSSNACPSGDGVSNWSKYVAGVDPNIAKDFPKTQAKSPAPPGTAMAIQWPSVSGKHYIILRSPSLFNGSWSAIGTNTGTGGQMEFDDTSSGKSQFYRVQILP